MLCRVHLPGKQMAVAYRVRLNVFTQLMTSSAELQDRRRIVAVSLGGLRRDLVK